MSINSMTNSAAGRRTDLLPHKLPASIVEIAAAARKAPTPASPEAASPEAAAAKAPAAKAEADPPAPVNTALNLLFGYIPTEVVTVYVAVLAALEGSAPPADTLFTFYIFLAVTPLVVWVVFASKIKALGKRLPWRFGALPLWEMFAATLAFTGWVAALPNSPFDMSQAMAGLMVLITSTVIGLLAPLFQQELKP